MLEVKFRIDEKELVKLKRAKGKFTWRELMWLGAEANKKQKKK